MTPSDQEPSNQRSDAGDIAEVWIIIPHPIVRSGIRSQLSGSGFVVTVESGSFPCAVGPSPMTGLPRIAIIDASFGTSEISELKAGQPGLIVVVLAEHAELSFLASAFEAGADGYLLKSISSAALLDSMRLVLHGEKVFPSIVTNFLSTLLCSPSERTDRAVRVGDIWLSDREIQILKALALGHTNKRIAKALNLTEATVKVNLKSVLRKLGLSNRTQVAIWAVQNNLLGSSGEAKAGARADRRIVSASAS